MTEKSFKEYEEKFYAAFPKVTNLEPGQSKEEIIGRAVEWWMNEKPADEVEIFWWRSRPNIKYRILIFFIKRFGKTIPDNVHGGRKRLFNIDYCGCCNFIQIKGKEIRF